MELSKEVDGLDMNGNGVDIPLHPASSKSISICKLGPHHYCSHRAVKVEGGNNRSRNSPMAAWR
jgi:hypothetical protein